MPTSPRRRITLVGIVALALAGGLLLLPDPAPAPASSPSAVAATPTSSPTAALTSALTSTLTSTPTPGSSTSASTAVTAAAAAKPRKPKPATRTRKARNVPELPRDGGKGRRIVYDKALMTVWIMDKGNEVVARYPVVGRLDRPLAGKYRIYSKSPSSRNPDSGATFDHMVRFAWGTANGGLSIGFHSIPRYRDGKRMHGIDQLGLPIARGGCVRMADDAAEFLYEWSKVGDRVIVLPSP